MLLQGALGEFALGDSEVILKLESVEWGNVAVAPQNVTFAVGGNVALVADGATATFTGQNALTANTADGFVATGSTATFTAQNADFTESIDLTADESTATFSAQNAILAADGTYSIDADVGTATLTGQVALTENTASTLTADGSTLTFGVSSGPELVTNGTFDTDLSGWIVGSRVNATSEVGQARVESNTDTTGFKAAYQSISVDSSREYVASMTLVSKDSTGALIRLGDNIATGEYINSGAEQIHSATFQPAGSQIWATFLLDNTFLTGVGAFYDSVSVRATTPLDSEKPGYAELNIDADLVADHATCTFTGQSANTNDRLTADRATASFVSQDIEWSYGITASGATATFSGQASTLSLSFEGATATFVAQDVELRTGTPVIYMEVDVAAVSFEFQAVYEKYKFQPMRTRAYARRSGMGGRVAVQSGLRAS